MAAHLHAALPTELSRITASPVETQHRVKTLPRDVRLGGEEDRRERRTVRLAAVLTVAVQNAQRLVRGAVRVGNVAADARTAHDGVGFRHAR